MGRSWGGAGVQSSARVSLSLSLSGVYAGVILCCFFPGGLDLESIVFLSRGFLTVIPLGSWVYDGSMLVELFVFFCRGASAKKRIMGSDFTPFFFPGGFKQRIISSFPRNR